jgi:hypothetical protein
VRNMTRTSSPFFAAAALVAGLVGAPAHAENCADTTFTALASIDCAGSFVGNINGSASETTFLNTEFGSTFTYVGKSDDAGNGPFTSNPAVNMGGTLTFDSAISGMFVIGLKAANNYSYYLFDAVSPVTSLTFNSTAGVAVNVRGIPQDLSHANLYITTAVPEPETYALMLAGLGVVGFMAKRRRRS